MSSRYDRSIRFFGVEGQAKLRKTKVTVVGVGGVGGHIVQQLALLGPRSIGVVDAEELDETNLNRYVTARAGDPIPGTPKTEIAKRLILEIDPSIEVLGVPDSLVSERAFELVKDSDFVFGSVDSEGARLVLTELCAAYRLPYIDVASDIEQGSKTRYGGRVCSAIDGDGCLFCLGQIDLQEAQADLGGREARELREAVYGVDIAHLNRSGPSVASINGVVASLAVTELMVTVTGIRKAHRLLTYRGNLGTVSVSLDEPRKDCFYCRGVWGTGPAADTGRYIREGVGAHLR